MNEKLNQATKARKNDQELRTAKAEKKELTFLKKDELQQVEGGRRPCPPTAFCIWLHG